MFDGLLGLDSSLGERAASMPESARTTRGGTPANVTAFSSYTEKGNINWQPVNLRGAWSPLHFLIVGGILAPARILSASFCISTTIVDFKDRDEAGKRENSRLC